MFASLIISFLFSAFLIQPLAKESINNEFINPLPVVVDSEKIIAGAQSIREPVRINYQKKGLELSARSALVIDRDSNKILFEKNPDQKLPIASISKLVTALVFLENNPGWDKIIEMDNSDQVGGASIKVGDGESLKVRDIFNSSLIGSANNATMALVRVSGLSRKDFVVAMNKKAREIGMAEAYFAEPTGLNQVNHATAEDLAQLIKKVLDDKEIRGVLGLEEYTFITLNTGRSIFVKNTDKLLKSFLNNGGGYNILGGKTGYTEEASFCLGVGAENEEKKAIIVVVLGSETNEARFREAKALIWWTFNNWSWD